MKQFMIHVVEIYGLTYFGLCCLLSKLSQQTLYENEFTWIKEGMTKAKEAIIHY